MKRLTVMKSTEGGQKGVKRSRYGDVCEFVKRKAKGTVGAWADEREEQKKPSGAMRSSASPVRF